MPLESVNCSAGTGAVDAVEIGGDEAGGDEGGV